MSRYHYRKVRLDDELGSRVLERYVDLFDPSHSVFLASDIADFDLHRTRVDDALHRGRLDLAFAVFDRYRLRMEDRARTASELAAGDFDFAREEELEIDRGDAPWPRSAAVLDDYWRRRVKNDILELELAGHDREGDTGDPPDALRPHGAARPPDRRRRRRAVLPQCLHPVDRPAQRLLLAALVGELPDPDEPFARGDRSRTADRGGAHRGAPHHCRGPRRIEAASSGSTTGLSAYGRTTNAR